MNDNKFKISLKIKNIKDDKSGLVIGVVNKNDLPGANSNFSGYVAINCAGNSYNYSLNKLDTFNINKDSVVDIICDFKNNNIS